MRGASEAPAADLVRRAAEALTAKGFPTQPRAAEAGLADEAEASEDRRRGELQRSMVRPAGARRGGFWGLMAFWKQAAPCKAAAVPSLAVGPWSACLLCSSGLAAHALLSFTVLVRIAGQLQLSHAMLVTQCICLMSN